jgi:hypothetical protein
MGKHRVIQTTNSQKQVVEEEEILTDSKVSRGS